MMDMPTNYILSSQKNRNNQMWIIMAISVIDSSIIVIRNMLIEEMNDS